MDTTEYEESNDDPSSCQMTVKQGNNKWLHISEGKIVKEEDFSSESRQDYIQVPNTNTKTYEDSVNVQPYATPVEPAGRS